MLNRIKLTNFQRHRALEVVFNGGLTALRGANEAGKSTLLRSICYACFGVKGAGLTLSELVTWGEEEKSLRVELELLIENVVYSIKRGKSGAEVNYDGGIVTGQNEVTAKVCTLLKCDAAAAARLILANQNEIRGALEAGPKATTELIERLAEFDQIDNLVELIEEKLTLGATAGVESAIAKAQEQLDAARGAAVEPDTDTLEDAITANEELVRAVQGDLNDAKERVEAATGNYNDAKVLDSELKGYERELKQVGERLETVETELVQLRAVQAPGNAEERVNGLRRDIDAFENRSKVRGAYNLVKKHFGTREEVPAVFHCLPDALEDDLTILVKGAKEDRRLATQHEKAAATKRALITSGSCTACGKDISQLPEIAARNEELRKDAARLESEAKALIAQAEGTEAATRQAEEVLARTAPVLSAFAHNVGYVEIVDSSLPPLLRWTGPTIGDDDVNVSEIRRQISDIEKQQRDFDRAAAKIETLTEERKRLYTSREDLTEKRNRVKSFDLDLLRTRVEAARDALRPLQERAQQAQQSLDAARRAKVDAVASFERAKAAVEAAQATLAQRRGELQELQFNNTLLKRVRACRPMIADRLWTLVLSAVSTYFSEMRGSKSRVTKTSEGFMVDGHSVTTLSGSTLDVLGLAIRVALVRTFLPGAPFLILDEPASACDDERTNNMLGFLAGAGFKQVLLVTHEDISQAIADNVVTL